MSSKNRVNPDHYKIAGRDPQAGRPSLGREKQAAARREAGRAGAATRVGARKRPGAPAPRPARARGQGRRT
jgi:hypothetical protein